MTYVSTQDDGFSTTQVVAAIQQDTRKARAEKSIKDVDDIEQLQ